MLSVYPLHVSYMSLHCMSVCMNMCFTRAYMHVWVYARVNYNLA